MAPLSTSGTPPLPGGAAPITPNSGLIAGASATPSTIPAAAVAAVTGGGATGANDAAAAAQLTTLITIVTTLIGMLQAQRGAASATGGGAVNGSTGGATLGGGAVIYAPVLSGNFAGSSSGAVLGNATVGGPDSFGTNGWQLVDSSVPTITNAVAPGATGGGAVGGGVVIGGASGGTLGTSGVGVALAMNGAGGGSGGSTIGGGFGTGTNGWSLVDNGPSPAGGTQPMPSAAAAPATNPPAGAQPAATGGGATAAAGTPIAEATAPVGTTVDLRRIVGAPAPGGVISTILGAVSINAMPPMNEGAWIVLSDENGAQMQVHAHGRWATASNAQIIAGIQSKQISVHLHADGTVHLHDAM